MVFRNGFLFERPTSAHQKVYSKILKKVAVERLNGLNRLVISSVFEVIRLKPVVEIKYMRLVIRKG